MGLFWGEVTGATPLSQANGLISLLPMLLASHRPEDEGRARVFSGVLPGHAYRFAWSRYRHVQEESARHGDLRRCAADGWRRHGAAHVGSGARIEFRTPFRAS